jgi:hypothetical protein
MLVETDSVLAVIRQWLLGRHPHPRPLPQAGEGVDMQTRSPSDEAAKLRTTT